MQEKLRAKLENDRSLESESEHHHDGPFSGSVNDLLSEAFGRSLGSLRVHRKQDASNRSAGAVARCEGGNIHLSSDIIEDPGHGPSMEILGHEAAHALAPATASPTEAVSDPGDACEVQAEQAGQRLRHFVESGGQAPVPSLKPATHRSAQVHRKKAEKTTTQKKDPQKKEFDQTEKFSGEFQRSAGAYSKKFKAYGVEVSPDLLQAMAMQESRGNPDVVSYDKGLGLMQITPTGKPSGVKGQQGHNDKVWTMDTNVAKVIGFNNSKSFSENRKSDQWKKPGANIDAANELLLNKLASLKRLSGKNWDSRWAKLNSAQRIQLLVFAFNAGEGNAHKALRNFEKTGSLKTISYYKGKDGKYHANDHTGKVLQKLAYVEANKPMDRNTYKEKKRALKERKKQQLSEPQLTGEQKKAIKKQYREDLLKLKQTWKKQKNR